MNRKKTTKKNFYFNLLKIFFVIIAIGSIIQYFLKAEPIIIRHEKPQTELNYQAWIDQGCQVTLNHYRSGNHLLDCSQLEIEEVNACDRTLLMPASFAYLSPQKPLAVCVKYFQKPPLSEKKAVTAVGCLSPTLITYITIDNNQIKMINTGKEFQEIFAPIESEQEALAYAQAVTNSYSMYNIKMPTGFKKLSLVIEESYAKKVKNGYKVHLFNDTICGCGLHPKYAIDYLVSFEGEIEPLNKKNIYVDPNFNACVD